MEPIFEIHERDTGKHYKIYENGEVEGFSKDSWIINNIPLKEMYLQALGLLEKNYQNNPKYNMKKFIPINQ